MTTTPARKTVVTGAIATFTACAAVAALSVAQAAPRDTKEASGATLSTTDMPSSVEQFAYPNAAQILKDQKITLKQGDGHILLTDCASAYDIKVESRTGKMYFCFAVTGKQGFVTMELPEAYGLWAQTRPVQAKITADGTETVINAPKGVYKPMGETGNDGAPSMLVELRVNG